MNKQIRHISESKEKSQTTYDYDSNGMIRHKTMFVNGQKRFEAAYDASGRIVSSIVYVYYTKDQLFYTMLYTYNKIGQVKSRVIHTYLNGKKKQQEKHYQYFPDGKEKSQEVYNYDNNGDMEERTLLVQGKMKFLTRYKYFIHQLKSEITYDADYKKKHEIMYGTGGQKNFEVIYDAHGHEKFTIQYSYDVKNQLISKMIHDMPRAKRIDVMYNTDNRKVRSISEYHILNGQIISETVYDVNGKRKHETVHFSDQNTEQHTPVKKDAKKLFIHKLAIALITRGYASHQDNTPPAHVLNTQHQR